MPKGPVQNIAPAPSTGCCAPIFLKFKNTADVNKDGKLDNQDLREGIANLEESAATIASHLKMDATKAESFVQAMLINVNKLINILKMIEPFIKATDPQDDKLVLDAIGFLQNLAPLNSAAVSVANSVSNITAPTNIATFNQTLTDAQQTSSVVEANLLLLQQAGFPGTDAALEGLKKVDVVLAKAKDMQQAVINAEKQVALITGFNAIVAEVAAAAPIAPTRVAPAP